MLGSVRNLPRCVSKICGEICYRKDRINQNNFVLFVFLALIGFGTLSFASTFLKVTSSHFKTFIVLVLKSKQVAEEVAKIMDLHVAKGYSYIIAWIGESLMVVNMITTIVEARVVRSEFRDESYKLVNRRKRNIVV